MPSQQRFLNHWLRIPREPLLVSIALVSLVIVVFAQTIGHGFINFDDDFYVGGNPKILEGVTLEGLKCAIFSICDANWIPMTMLVHMVDCQLYGSWAGGHHLTCLLLHAFGASLLFFLLRSMTGSIWRSATVSALWAVHPLRVESVAWVAELKDVLSGVFFLLTLMAYVAYVNYTRNHSKALGSGAGAGAGALGRYLVVMLLFALGLMSKPMLVTLPFALLLLDYWPLRRMTRVGNRDALEDVNSRPDECWKKSLLHLILEKLPLLLLSLLSVMVTIWAQKEAIQTMAPMSLGQRSGNAVMAYGTYLFQMLWPAGLSVYYPVSAKGIAPWEVGVVFVMLLGVSLWMIAARKKTPYLFMGWFWYLGMLVPVIGILKVGSQAYADRYTYLPMIGILIAVVWGAERVTRKWSLERHPVILSGLVALLIVTLTALSWKQTSLWANNETLWRHSIACTEENDTALTNLGEILIQQEKPKEAEMLFRRALLCNPSNKGAVANLATTLAIQGKSEEAMANLREILRLNPNDDGAHNNLGNILLGMGSNEEATVEFRRSVEICGNEQARCNLGTALMRMGRLDEAIDVFRALVLIAPNSPILHNNLGSALYGQGHVSEAIAEYRAALKADPGYPTAQKNLEQALIRQSRSTQ